MYADFAEAMASGEVEMNGVLLSDPVFTGGVVATPDGMAEHPPVDVDLDPASAAIDAGMDLSGINGGYMGGGPDIMEEAFDEMVAVTRRAMQAGHAPEPRRRPRTSSWSSTVWRPAPWLPTRPARRASPSTGRPTRA